MMQKTQRHSSHVDMFFKCGVQYECRYVYGLSIPPLVAALTGTGTHGGIQPNMVHKVTTGELLSLEAVQEAARDATNAAWDRQGARLIPEEKERGEKTVRGESVDMAVALAGLHHQEVAPGIDPSDVEKEWVLELPGFPCDLAGRIDLREKSGRIRDTKTRSKTPPPSDAAQMSQLTVYSLAALKKWGSLPELAVDYLVKTKTPKAVTQTTVRTGSDIDRFLLKLGAMELALEKGVFLPATPGSWWCSAKWCGYWSRCKYVS